MTDERSGVLTFLFTDVEGSTRGWDTDPAAMSAALAAHDATLRRVFARHDGRAFSQAGDSFAVAFARPADAVAAAVDAQRELRQGGVKVRMGVHAGAAEERDGLYFGAELNRAARVMGLGAGGQVLLSDAARALMPPGVMLRDLGLQRLSGFSRPERLWQLQHPDLTQEFPDLPGIRTENLPQPTTPLIGRAADRRAVAAALSSTRVLTLLGPGGIGKTRLAVEVGRSLVEQYRDGVRFVDLTPVARGELVAASVAGALGVRLGHGSDPHAALAAHVEDRQLLVILDNCEHVVDDAAKVVRLLVSGDAATRVLATSRVRLRVAAEMAFPVGALDARSPEGAAVELFLGRAQQVAPDVTADPDAATLALDICAHLDGMPLAIELAASRVGAMSLEVLRDRLSDRFRLLDGSVAEREDHRVRSLRATVDWSYDLLPAGTRRVFERLAVFAGSFSVAAAEAVVGGADTPVEEVLSHLTELVAASLVQFDRTGGSSYRLLETFRVYGLDRLRERGELAELRDRHADHVLRRVADLAELPYDRTGVLRRRAGAREIVDDGFAALDHLTGGSDLARLRRALQDMSELWWEHRPRDAVPFLERAVLACDGSANADADAIRGLAALLLFFLSTSSRARPLAEPVVRRHDAAGTPPPIPALVALTLGTLRSGDPEPAMALAQRLADGAPTAQDPTERLLALGFGGWVLANLGDGERGVRLCEEAVRTDHGRTAWILALSNIYADAMSLSGRPEEALMFCREGIAGRFDLTSYGRLNMLRVVAQANLVMRQIPETRRHLRELVLELVETGDVSMLPLVLELTSVLLVHEHEPRTAARLVGAAEGLRGDSYVGAPLEVATREWLQRRIRRALGDEAEAEFARGVVLDRLAALTTAAEALAD